MNAASRLIVATPLLILLLLHEGTALTAQEKKPRSIPSNYFEDAYKICDSVHAGISVVTGPDVISNGGNDHTFMVMYDHFSQSNAQLSALAGSASWGLTIYGTKNGDLHAL